MMLTPRMGKELIITGNNAQCMAQAIDVAIPNASQLIFIFIFGGKDSIFAIRLQVLNWLNDLNNDGVVSLFGCSFAKK